jgi:hypothetical protein
VLCNSKKSLSVPQALPSLSATWPNRRRLRSAPSGGRIVRTTEIGLLSIVNVKGVAAPATIEPQRPSGPPGTVLHFTS